MVKNIIKHSYIILFILLLASCISSQSGIDNLVQIQKENIKISIPSNYVQIRELENNNILLSFSSETYVNGFANSFVLTKEHINDKNMDSRGFFNSNVYDLSKRIYEFNKLDNQQFQIQVRDKSINVFIIVFEGKYELTDPVRKFIQLYCVYDNFGYIATFNLSLDRDANIFINILKTFEIIN